MKRKDGEEVSNYSEKQRIWALAPMMPQNDASKPLTLRCLHH